jgi:hypothetical protein
MFIKGVRMYRQERGWAGHFIGALNCRFRRNTLIEYAGIRVVISSVGLFETEVGSCKFMSIHPPDAYFETKVFYANSDERYYDADVSRELCEYECYVRKMDADDEANIQHEDVVNRVIQDLVCGKIKS